MYTALEEEQAKVRRCGNENADLWTRFSRAVYDVDRDRLSTPAFFEMLHAVDGLSGLGIGCGEGYNTRLLTEQGAHITGVDLTDVFLRHATRLDDRQQPRLRCLVTSAARLSFSDASFDFAPASGAS